MAKKKKVVRKKVVKKVAKKKATKVAGGKRSSAMAKSRVTRKRRDSRSTAQKIEALAEAIAQAPVKVATRALPLTKPAPAKTFTLYISRKDGYGLTECLLSGKACGQVVADSWCSAHGYGVAQSWGDTNDMTASVKLVAHGSKGKAPPKDHLAITCKE